MPEFKLTIGDPKKGKCYQKTATDNNAKAFIGLKIGDNVKGDSIGLAGYEFKITGGSDYCGFPMRKGISGARKRVLIERGVGFKGKGKGVRKRRTVCGEAIYDKITQINLKILKYGKAPLAEEKAAEGEAKKKEEKTKEAQKTEKKEAADETKKEAPKTGEKKEDKKE